MTGPINYSVFFGFRLICSIHLSALLIVIKFYNLKLSTWTKINF